MYPNRFVKFEIVDSHVEDGKEFVDDVAVINGIDDGKEAMKEFINCKDNQFVYSTKHERVVIELNWLNILELEGVGNWLNWNLKTGFYILQSEAKKPGIFSESSGYIE